MTRPKRHHWWPLVQSTHWTDSNGTVFVTRADGSTFRTNPTNIGVESELYTRFGDNDTKDTSVEDWFASQIDGPAKFMIEHILDSSNAQRIPFKGDESKAATLRRLGYRTNDYVDVVQLPKEVRIAIARYLAALLVRHPTYISKLTEFHRSEEISDNEVRDLALSNMIHMYDVYSEIISQAMMMITRRVESNEFLYADGGLSVQEPWRRADGIPFDIHAPITPDISLQVVPLPIQSRLDIAPISEATNVGVAKQNRIILGSARRFVFSRSPPSLDFIRTNFGIPAPKNIGYRFVDGRLETRYDPQRR